MNGFTSILVPVDGSKHSERALKTAIYMADLCGAKLGILHVIDLNLQVSAFEQVSMGGYVPDEIKEAGRELLKLTSNQVPENISTETFLEFGAPAETIVTFCQEKKYELIIMGSRGLGSIKQVIMGSVSHYILGHIHCPVMIVK